MLSKCERTKRSHPSEKRLTRNVLCLTPQEGNSLVGFSAPPNTRLNTTVGNKLRVALASLAHQTKHPRANSGTASRKKCRLFAALAQNPSYHHALTRAPFPPRCTSGRSTLHIPDPSLLQNVAQHVTDRPQNGQMMPSLKHCHAQFGGRGSLMLPVILTRLPRQVGRRWHQLSVGGLFAVAVVVDVTQQSFLVHGVLDALQDT